MIKVDHASKRYPPGFDALSDISFDDDSARGAMRRHLPVSTEIERDDVSMLLRVLPLFEDDVATADKFDPTFLSKIVD